MCYFLGDLPHCISGYIQEGASHSIACGVVLPTEFYFSIPYWNSW